MRGRDGPNGRLRHSSTSRPACRSLMQAVETGRLNQNLRVVPGIERPCAGHKFQICQRGQKWRAAALVVLPAFAGLEAKRGKKNLSAFRGLQA